MLARQQTHVDVLPTGERPGALAVVNKLHDDRESARKKLLAALRDPRYTQLLDHMVGAAKEPQFAEDANQPAKGLADFAAQAFAKLKEAVDELDPDPQPPDLHRVRILTKRARYVAEALIPVAGKDAERFADHASDLQDVLGELQDATVAGEWLNEFARSTPQAAFIAGKLAGMETVAGLTALGEWRDAWDKLDRKKVTGWLSG
jgi:CHAD domain-containing protein